MTSEQQQAPAERIAEALYKAVTLVTGDPRLVLRQFEEHLAGMRADSEEEWGWFIGASEHINNGVIDETKLAIADSPERRVVMDAIALCRDRAVADVAELEEDDDGPLPEPSTSRLSAFQKDFAELVAAFAAFDDELVGKLVRVRAIRGKGLAEQFYDQMYTAVGLRFFEARRRAKNILTYREAQNHPQSHKKARRRAFQPAATKEWMSDQDRKAGQDNE